MNATIDTYGGIPVALVGSETVFTEISGSDVSREGELRPTSGLNDIRRQLSDLPKLAAALAEDIGNKIRSNQAIMPDEVGIELRLALGAECKFWVIGAKGEQAVTLKLTWKNARSLISPDESKG